jgi:uncharacterized membrane protein
MTFGVTDTMHRDPTKAADTALKAAARLWFLVAVIGQWIFVYYIVFFYGASAVQGDLEAWNKVLPHGYIAGDTVGNFAVAMHLLLAAIITVGGPLQLVLGAIITGGGPRQLSPQFRARVPAVHHWNGRIYLLTALAISLDGLFMAWTRGVAGGQPFGISLNAVLIMICAAMAVRYAVARDIATHRRWALRLFLVVSGVWFFRVGLMGSIFLNNGPFGFDPATFRGPFLTFLGFAQYLLPLAVLELYLRTQDRAGAPGRFAMAAGLFVLTVAMGIGIFAATMGMWLPRL